MPGDTLSSTISLTPSVVWDEMLPLSMLFLCSMAVALIATIGVVPVEAVLLETLSGSRLLGRLNGPSNFTQPNDLLPALVRYCKSDS